MPLKLVVGQEVHMSCGYYVCKGEVVEVTPEGVVVRHKDQSNTGELLRFDSNGKGWYINDTFDCPGPWYIEV